MSSATQHRGDYIREKVYETGRVSVRELAKELDVSEATIRRDLKVLSDAGEVELVYGGAALPHKREFSFRSKASRETEAKAVIGALAASLVTDDEQIFVDSGSTCFQMARYLKSRRNVSVIVNSARLALELDAPGLKVILLGGQYRPDRMDTVGPMATAALEQLRGYVAFIGCDGLSREFGLAASDLESAHLHGLAVRNSRRTVLLADHTKFLAPSLFRIVAMEAVSVVVTDRPPLPEWAAYFESQGIDVIFPAPLGGTEQDRQ